MDRRIVFISVVAHLFKHLTIVEVEDHLEASVCSALTSQTSKQVEGMNHN